MTTTDPVITTYVEYIYPGMFFPETAARPVTSRDPQHAAREAPPSAFAFRYYDVVAASAAGTELRSGEVNVSGRYYIDAEKLTAADVEALPGDHRILLENMICNGWDPILRCRAGNFQPLEDGDVLVSSQEGTS